MARSKTEGAALRVAATTHAVNKVTQENDEREERANSSGLGLHPGVIMQHKLETFFKVSLGESRYLQYMAEYQALRSGLLDELEAALREQELARGAGNFNLVGANGAPFGTPG